MRLNRSVGLLIILLVFALAGCGGGGSDGSGRGGSTNAGSNRAPANENIAPIPNKNIAPIADAGPNQNVETGAIVRLDGSGSRDADRDLITYQWRLVSQPNGSNVSLKGKNTATPSFRANITGEYVVQLVVNDGTTDSKPDQVTITAATGNVAPVADAGPDQNLQLGAKVTLDGSGSSDADWQDLLTYRWHFVSIPPDGSADLKGAKTVSPSFTADEAGDYVVKLTVNDGNVDSASDRVTISIAADNSAPVADAGPDQNIKTGSLVQLDGQGSHDADGDQITYDWFFVSKPASSNAALSDANSATPWFRADVAGDYVVRLIVNDGTVDSDPDTVTITAAAGNSIPIADAGLDQYTKTGMLVPLDGDGSSDADGDPLTYRWSFVSVPRDSRAELSNPSTKSPGFIPDVNGEYVVELVVNDGRVDSAPDHVTITATRGNLPPVADAGPDRHVTPGDKVTLHGSDSSDADGDPLSYSWEFVSKPTDSSAKLRGANTVSPFFIADVAGDYVIRLTVNDGHVESQDEIMVTAARGFNGVCGVPERNVESVAVRALGQITTDPVSYTAGWYSLRAISATEIVMWGGSTKATKNAIRVYDRALDKWRVLHENSPFGSFIDSTETWKRKARKQWCPNNPDNCKILTGTDTHLQFYIPNRNEMLIWGTSRSRLFGGVYDFDSQEWTVIWKDPEDIGTHSYITADTVEPAHIFPENASHRWVDPDGPGGSLGVGVIIGGTPQGNPTDKLLLIKRYQGPGDAYVFEMFEDWNTPPIALKNNRNGAIAAGECFYLFGGQTNFGPTNAVWRYHVPTDTWTRMADMPVPSSWNAASFDPRTNRVVVLTGTDQVYLYDLEENTWREVTAEANLPNASQAASAYAGGIHIISARSWNGNYQARERFYGIKLSITH